MISHVEECAQFVKVLSYVTEDGDETACTFLQHSINVSDLSSHCFYVERLMTPVRWNVTIVHLSCRLLNSRHLLICNDV